MKCIAEMTRMELCEALEQARSEKEYAIKRAAEAEARFEEAVKVAMMRASAETVSQLESDINSLKSRLKSATGLVRDWSNFDFDCPDEYDFETDEEMEDGWALEQLCNRTAVFFRSEEIIEEDSEGL